MDWPFKKHEPIVIEHVPGHGEYVGREYAKATSKVIGTELEIICCVSPYELNGKVYDIEWAKKNAAEQVRRAVMQAEKE